MSHWREGKNPSSWVSSLHGLAGSERFVTLRGAHMGDFWVVMS